VCRLRCYVWKRLTPLAGFRCRWYLIQRKNTKRLPFVAPECIEVEGGGAAGVLAPPVGLRERRETDGRVIVPDSAYSSPGGKSQWLCYWTVCTLEVNAKNWPCFRAASCVRSAPQYLWRVCRVPVVIFVAGQTRVANSGIVLTRRNKIRKQRNKPIPKPQ